VIHAGKCPKCENAVTSVSLEPVDVTQAFTQKWHGVSFLCPHCQTVLGVGIDPVALKTETVKGVVKALHGAR
jgi:hypothetical protein